MFHLSSVSSIRTDIDIRAHAARRKWKVILTGFFGFLVLFEFHDNLTRMISLDYAGKIKFKCQ